MTSSQPPVMATAVTRFRPAAYRVRDKMAVSPYPTRPGANSASAPASWRAWDVSWLLNTRASGRHAPASTAAPSHDISRTARLAAALVARNSPLSD